MDFSSKKRKKAAGEAEDDTLRAKSKRSTLVSTDAVPAPRPLPSEETEGECSTNEETATLDSEGSDTSGESDGPEGSDYDEDSDGSEESDELDEGNESDDGSDTGLEIHFALREPGESYFHGVRNHLSTHILPGLAVEQNARKKAKKEVRRLDDDKATVTKSRIIDLHARPPLATRLAEAIVGQVNIGSIVTVDEPDEPDEATEASEESGALSGFGTILNLRQWPAAHELVSKLLKLASNSMLPRHQHAFSRLLQDPSQTPEKVSKNKMRLDAKRQVDLFELNADNRPPVVGLLLADRVLNAPHRIGPALLKALVKDVQWSQTTKMSKSEEKERPFFFFTHLIGVTTALILPRSMDLGKEKEESETYDCPEEWNDRCLTPDLLKNNRLYFLKFEDKILLDQSLAFFSLPTGNTRQIPVGSGRAEVSENRLVFVIKYEKLKTVVKEARRVEAGASAGVSAGASAGVSAKASAGASAGTSV